MIEDVTAGLAAVTVPVTVVTGDRDHVEHAAALREVFASFLPHATFRVLTGIGRLAPVEAPDALADNSRGLLDGLPGTLTWYEMKKANRIVSCQSTTRSCTGDQRRSASIQSLQLHRPPIPLRCLPSCPSSAMLARADEVIE